MPKLPAFAPDYKAAQVAGREAASALSTASAQRIAGDMRRWADRLAAELATVGSGPGSAQRRAAVEASRRVIMRSVAGLEAQVAAAVSQSRSLAFSDVRGVWLDAQRSLAQAAGLTNGGVVPPWLADVGIVEGAAMGRVRSGALTMAAAYERLGGAGKTWKTALPAHFGATADELDTIVRESLLAGTGTEDLARRLRPYVLGAEPFHVAFPQADVRFTKLYDNRNLPPELRGAAQKLRYNATRIAYTETWNARAEAELESFAVDPAVNAVRWRTAPNRGQLRKPDICDAYAKTDWYGLGPGIFPLDAVPLPPHPFCRCFRDPVLRDFSEWGKPKPTGIARKKQVTDALGLHWPGLAPRLQLTDVQRARVFDALKVGFAPAKATAAAGKTLRAIVAQGNSTAAALANIAQGLPAAFAAAKKIAPPVVVPKQAPHEIFLAEKVGAQAGSNPGGLYRGSDGVLRYVKFYDDPAQGQGEAIANAIYRKLGLGAPESFTFATADGKTAFASVIIEGVGEKATIKSLGLTAARADAILDGFAADVLMSNWDAVGLGLDNVVEVGGKVYRIDNGSAFLFRAMGGRKPANVLKELTELKGFAPGGVNPDYANVFRKAGILSGDIPDAMGDRLAKQIRAIEAMRDGLGDAGWLGLIDDVAPGMDAAAKAAVLDMLDVRFTKLTGVRASIEAAAETAKKAAVIAARRDRLDAISAKLASITHAGAKFDTPEVLAALAADVLDESVVPLAKWEAFADDVVKTIANRNDDAIPLHVVKLATDDMFKVIPQAQRITMGKHMFAVADALRAVKLAGTDAAGELLDDVLALMAATRNSTVAEELRDVVSSAFSTMQTLAAGVNPGAAIMRQVSNVIENATALQTASFSKATGFFGDVAATFRSLAFEADALTKMGIPDRLPAAVELYAGQSARTLNASSLRASVATYRKGAKEARAWLVGFEADYPADLPDILQAWAPSPTALFSDVNDIADLSTVMRLLDDSPIGVTQGIEHAAGGVLANARAVITVGREYRLLLEEIFNGTGGKFTDATPTFAKLAEAFGRAQFKPGFDDSFFNSFDYFTNGKLSIRNMFDAAAAKFSASLAAAPVAAPTATPAATVAKLSPKTKVKQPPEIVAWLETELHGKKAAGVNAAASRLLANRAAGGLSYAAVNAMDSPTLKSLKAALVKLTKTGDYGDLQKLGFYQNTVPKLQSYVNAKTAGGFYGQVNFNPLPVDPNAAAKAAAVATPAYTPPAYVPPSAPSKPLNGLGELLDDSTDELVRVAPAPANPSAPGIDLNPTGVSFTDDVAKKVTAPKSAPATGGQSSGQFTVTTGQSAAKVALVQTAKADGITLTKPLEDVIAQASALKDDLYLNLTAKTHDLIVANGLDLNLQWGAGNIGLVVDAVPAPGKFTSSVNKKVKLAAANVVKVRQEHFADDVAEFLGFTPAEWESANAAKVHAALKAKGVDAVALYGTDGKLAHAIVIDPGALKVDVTTNVPAGKGSLFSGKPAHSASAVKTGYGRQVYDRLDIEEGTTVVGANGYVGRKSGKGWDKKANAPAGFLAGQDETGQYLGKHMGGSLDFMEPAEAAATRAYTGSAYQGANLNLRAGGQPTSADRAMAKGLRRRVTDRAVVVNRGVGTDGSTTGTFNASRTHPIAVAIQNAIKSGEGVEGVGRRLVGKKFTDRGFGSHTVKSEVAVNFSTDGVILETYLPKGTPGVWAAQASHHGHELEFILPPGARYRILGVVFDGAQTNGAKVRVICELEGFDDF